MKAKVYCVSECMHRHRSSFITEGYELRPYKFREDQRLNYDIPHGSLLGYHVTMTSQINHSKMATAMGRHRQKTDNQGILPQHQDSTKNGTETNT
jgi:hypothetical protein